MKRSNNLYLICFSILLLFVSTKALFAENELPAADLSLIMTVDNPKSEPGGTVTYFVDVKNDGPLDATEVVTHAYIADGFSNVSHISNGGTLVGDTIIWNLGTVLDNQTVRLSFTVTLNPYFIGISYDNTAEIFSLAEYDRDSTPGNGVDPDGDGLIGPLDINPNDGSIDPNGEDDSDNEPVCIPLIDLSLIKTVSDPEPAYGDTIMYNIIVWNNGPDNATGVGVEDILPDGIDNIINISNGGILSGNVINWSSISLNVGDTITLSFEAEVVIGNNYVNIAEINMADQDDIDSVPGNDADNDNDGHIGSEDDDSTQDDDDEDDGDDAIINPRVIDLSLIKSVNKTYGSIGDSILFTITVVNDGPRSASNIIVSDYVPSSYSIVNADNGGVIEMDTITWTIDGLGVGASTDLSFYAILENDSDLQNIAEIVAADQLDIDSEPGNGADTDGDGWIGPLDDDGSQDLDDEDDGDDASVMLCQLDVEISGIDEICIDSCTTITATVQNAIGTLQYEWNTGATTSEITVCPNVDSVYYVNVMDDVWCTATDSIFISVLCNTTPEFNINPEITYDCAGQPEFDEIELMNVCSISNVEFEDQIDTTDCLLNVVRTFYITDECGNQFSTTQTAIAIDTVAPVLLNIPQDITVACPSDAPTLQDVTASDNCDQNLIIEFAQTDLPNCEGIIINSWYVEDCSGNFASAVQNITILDTIAPSFDSIPEDITISCLDLATVPLISATDNCGDVIMAQLVETSEYITCPFTKVITRIFTVEDCAGNAISTSQNITLIDTIAPVINGVGDNGFYDCGDTLIFSVPTAQDACSSVTLEFEDFIENLDCGSNKTRVWTATDACGNAATASQTFTELDEDPPAIFNVIDESFACDETPQFLEPDATDNCSSVTLSFIDNNNGENCGGNIITRTWIATDGCGNTSTAISTYIPIDDEAPIITNVGPDGNYDCTETPIFSIPSVEDNCSIPSISFVDIFIMGNCTGSGTTRLWTATDACGNISTAMQTLIPIDNTSPIITGIGDDGIYDCNDTPVFDTITVEDCIDFTVDIVDNNFGDDCINQGVTRVWTVTDACGNVSTAEQTMLFSDNTPPVIAGVGPDTIIDCGQNAEFSIPSVFDNCSDTLSFVSIDEIIDSTCAGVSVRRIWTATDDCGNVTTASQEIKYVDLTPPVFSGVLNGSYDCGEQPEFIEPNVTDECSEVNLSFTDEDAGSNCNGKIIIRTWLATDACGNAATATSIYSAVDNEAPIITNVGDDDLYDCEEMPVFSMPMVEDNCSTASLTFVDTFVMGNCTGSGTTRLWTATDACGNTSTASQTLIPEDNTPPVITGIGPDGSYNCDETPPFDDPYVSDCSDFTIEFEDQILTGTCFERGIERTWTVTDNCGNISTASQTMHSIDNMAPQIIGVGADTIINCGDSIPFSDPVAIDNCSDLVNLENSDEIISTNCAGETIRRTWIATDDCGNSSLARQIISIIDNEPPTILESAMDITYECDQSAEFTAPIVDDNCSEVSMSFVDTPGLPNCAGTPITRTWTLSDSCGNSISVSQTLTPVDSNNPEISGVGNDGTYNCGETPTFSEPTANDNCDFGDLVFEDIVTIDSCNIVLTRIWTATDACGNTSTASQSFTAFDDAAPEIIGVEDNGEYNCGDTPIFSEPTAVDNCTSTSLEFEDITTTTDCKVITIRTWTATDVCGNTATAVQSMTSVDTIDPVFTTVLADREFLCEETPVFDEVDVEDCSNVDLVFEDVVIDSICAGPVIQRIWTATDGCGNSATTSQTLTPVDEVAPVFDSIPAEIFFQCGTDPEFSDPMAIDNCSEVTLTYVNEYGSRTCAPDGIIRIWTATDECGNQSTIKQTLTPIDSIPPVFFGVGNGGTIECSEIPPFSDPTAEDECSGTAHITFEDFEINNGCNDHSITRIWTATDICENESTASETFIIVDTEAPTISLEMDSLFITCEDSIQFPNPIVSDRCSSVSLEFADQGGEDICAGEGVVRIWTATDECGNISTAAQVLFINDLTPPMIEPFEELIQYPCGEEEPDFTQITAIDNCTEVTITSIDTITTGNCAGEVKMRVWTVTDACGNSVTASQTIEPFDNVAPIIDVISENIEINCGDTTLLCTDLEQSKITFDLNDCNSFVVNLSNEDYSEFTSTEMNSANGPTLSNGILYRINPEENEHSCAPGINGTPAMCVDIDSTCVYNPNSEKSILIEFDIEPAAVGITSLSSLTFLENAPEQFTFLQGPTGPNDYPTRYGVRILLNGSEVFVESDIPTTNDWTIESFDLSNLDITIDQASQLQIQLLAYCPIGNGATMSVWDVEQIELEVISSESNETECNVTVDDCLDVTLEFVDIPQNNGNCTGGDFRRLWIATDECGNRSTATQNVTVVDNTNPIILGILGDGEYDCEDQPVFSEPYAIDECSAPTLSFTDNQDGDVITRTWTATDACGNTSTGAQSLTKVNCKIDLELDKSASISAAEIGETITFTIEVYNNSDNQANEVIVLDKLSDGFIYLSHDLSSGSYNPSSGLWDIGSIAPFETETLTIEVALTFADEYINLALVASAKEDDIDSEPNNRVDTNLDGNFSDDPNDEDDGDGVVIERINTFKMNIYPNPVINNAHLTLFSPINGELSWNLYNNQAKMVKSSLGMAIQKGMVELDIEVNDLPSGTYMLKLKVGNKLMTRKLIILN